MRHSWFYALVFEMIFAKDEVFFNVIYYNLGKWSDAQQL